MKRNDKALNFSRAKVVGLYSAIATAITVDDGSRFSYPMDVTWFDASKYSTPGEDPKREIVSITLIVGNVLTVTRASQGTTGSTKNTVGSTYRMVAGPTAKDVDIIIIKSANGVAVNNSIALVDDLELTFPIGANETWEVEVWLYWYSASANLKFDLSGPAAPTMVAMNSTAAGFPGPGVNSSAFSSGTLSQNNAGVASGNGVILTATIINGANAGNVALQIAQYAPVVENTVVLKGTKLKARRVA